MLTKSKNEAANHISIDYSEALTPIARSPMLMSDDQDVNAVSKRAVDQSVRKPSEWVPSKSALSWRAETGVGCKQHGNAVNFLCKGSGDSSTSVQSRPIP